MQEGNYYILMYKENEESDGFDVIIGVDPNVASSLS